MLRLMNINTKMGDEDNPVWLRAYLNKNNYTHNCIALQIKSYLGANLKKDLWFTRQLRTVSRIKSRKEQFQQKRIKMPFLY
jgi:hypothetical protein